MIVKRRWTDEFQKQLSSCKSRPANIDINQIIENKKGVHRDGFEEIPDGRGGKLEKNSINNYY